MTHEFSPLLIGVDGGGTGCRVAVGTQARGILAEATGGRANVSTDFDEAIVNITQAVGKAVQDASLDPADVTQAVAHLGLAGFTGPKIGDRVAAALPFARSMVSEDTVTTIVGAIGSDDGFVVALGTGTIIARQRAGVQKCIGGWCYQVSDQASGAWLGHGVLEQTLLVVDEIVAETPLSRLMLDRFDGPGGIVQFSLAARPGDFGTLAPDVVAAAAKGDAIGTALMHQGADYIEAALGALGYSQGDPLCLVGGVGTRYAPYLPAPLTDRLTVPKGRALDGAFALASVMAAT